jgi:hypothetical protein
MTLATLTTRGHTRARSFVVTVAGGVHSELRERALEEKKKKRKQKNDVNTSSEIMLPSGIPLLVRPPLVGRAESDSRSLCRSSLTRARDTQGRYEVHFADLHTLFGQNVQKPDNKIINLKVYYDIKYATARNQVRKEV